jgi:hypothetical protein
MVQSSDGIVAVHPSASFRWTSCSFRVISCPGRGGFSAQDAIETTTIAPKTSRRNLLMNLIAGSDEEE